MHSQETIGQIINSIDKNLQIKKKKNREHSQGT